MNTEHIITEYNFFKKLCELPCIEEIWLYGSRARNTNQQRSDIDLAILCQKVTDTDWRTILEIIETADTLLKIDCVRFDTLKEATFKTNIMHDKKILFSR